MGKKKSELTFEQSLDKLKEIVKHLEDGNVGLEESLSSYQTGVEHLKRCYATLQEAEKTVALISGIDDDGTITTDVFDATATIENHRASDKVAKKEVLNESESDSGQGVQEKPRARSSKKTRKVTPQKSSGQEGIEGEPLF